MTATASSSVKDQELVPLGLLESESVNSISDFMPSSSKECDIDTGKEMDDFVNTFICHFIFYAFLCLALFLHILIDLGLGSFIKNKFVELIGVANKIGFEKSPAFA